MDQESKPIIVVASILKPVDDIRMFGKIGLSLKNTGRYAIHSIGYPSANHSQPAENLHPLWRFRRISFGRMLAPLRVLIILFRLKPQLLIITTHELLFVAFIAKLALRCKVVYDIQENYYLNIRYTSAFPRLVRRMIAAYVRLKELISVWFVDHYFLAEQGYEDEIRFLTQATVLENKAIRPVKMISRKKAKSELRLLFSGTLAESTGVFVAIALAEEIHKIQPNVTLSIIGYCAKADELSRILSKIKGKEFIQLIGGDQLVPHPEIIQAINQAHLGIIAYPYNVSTISSTPTKLYEYLAYQLPMLLINHERWRKICEKYNAAVVFDPLKIKANEILRAYNEQTFYTNVPDEVFWETEEKKLLVVVDHLLTN